MYTVLIYTETDATETNEGVEYKKLSCLCENNSFEILIVSIFLQLLLVIQSTLF